MSAQPKIAAPLSSAMQSALVQQLIVLVLASTVLDGGVVAQMCFYALAAFWGGVAVIVFRRRLSPSHLDLILVRSGFLPTCVIAFLLTTAIWRWRGF